MDHRASDDIDEAEDDGGSAQLLGPQAEPSGRRRFDEPDYTECTDADKQLDEPALTVVTRDRSDDSEDDEYSGGERKGESSTEYCECDATDDDPHTGTPQPEHRWCVDHHSGRLLLTDLVEQFAHAPVNLVTDLPDTLR